MQGGDLPISHEAPVHPEEHAHKFGAVHLPLTHRGHRAKHKKTLSL